MNKLFILLVILMGVFSQPTFAQSIEVKNATVRSVIPGMANTVGYMQLINNKNQQAVLSAVSSDIASKVEVHDHVMNQGVMKMIKLDKLTIPANETKVFESGGLHLMFIGVDHSKPIKDSVLVTLKFLDGSEQQVTFKVKSIHHQHHH